MKCKSQSDARKLTQKASNLPQDPTGNGTMSGNFYRQKSKGAIQSTSTNSKDHL